MSRRTHARTLALWTSSRSGAIIVSIELLCSALSVRTGCSGEAAGTYDSALRARWRQLGCRQASASNRMNGLAAPQTSRRRHEHQTTTHFHRSRERRASVAWGIDERHRWPLARESQRCAYPSVWTRTLARHGSRPSARGGRDWRRTKSIRPRGPLSPSAGETTDPSALFLVVASVDVNRLASSAGSPSGRRSGSRWTGMRRPMARHRGAP
jgi:hypothetical protein